ncbi:hypothetical protein [Alteromonas sp. 14N.309.X.WAT.G.H12]|uniref:hypothetical protein n=1 Tax=Alteromonas sp. 14N.309.X.WAT.G.H12 TaxID=3120824 RepID=UPI002FD0A504
MRAFIKIPINSSIDPESVSDFQLYIVRANELLDNYQDIKKLGFDFGGGHMLLRDSNGLVTGAEVKVDKHRLKGLFLDFRFFIGNDEPTNFLRFSGAIGKYSDADSFRKYLKSLKCTWKNEGILKGWVGVNACELITTYFNSKAFHGRLDAEEKYKVLIEAMDSKTLDWLLCYYIDDRILCIKNLLRVISNFEKGYFEIPESA